MLSAGVRHRAVELSRTLWSQKGPAACVPCAGRGGGCIRAQNSKACWHRCAEPDARCQLPVGQVQLSAAQGKYKGLPSEGWGAVPSSAGAAPSHLPTVRGPEICIRVPAAVSDAPDFTSPQRSRSCSLGPEGRVAGAPRAPTPRALGGQSRPGKVVLTIENNEGT